MQAYIKNIEEPKLIRLKGLTNETLIAALKLMAKKIKSNQTLSPSQDLVLERMRIEYKTRLDLEQATKWEYNLNHYKANYVDLSFIESLL